MAGITQAEREQRDRLYERGLKQCNTCDEPLPLSDFVPRHDCYRGWPARAEHQDVRRPEAQPRDGCSESATLAARQPRGAAGYRATSGHPSPLAARRAGVAVRDKRDPNLWHVYIPGEPQAAEPPPAEEPSAEPEPIEYTPEEQFVNDQAISARARASHPCYR